MSGYDTEIFDRALAEIVGDTPLPRWGRGGWSVRSHWSPPLIELDDLSSDWWSSRTSFRSSRTPTRSRSASKQRRTAACSVARVQVSAEARAAIVRELARDWDGREQGGALVGHIVGDTVVVEYAGGLGIGVPTPRGNAWVRLSSTRMHDFAVSYRAELVGDWHSHRDSTLASSADERAWERLRAALGAQAYVGLIVAPTQDKPVLSWSNPRLRAYLVTENGCEAVDLT